MRSALFYVAIYAHLSQRHLTFIEEIIMTELNQWPAEHTIKMGLRVEYDDCK